MTAPARERHQTGTVMLRERRIAMASEGAAALAGRPLPALLGLPFADLFAPEDRGRVAERHERRLRGEPVPSEYEAVLLRPDGARVTVELRVEREGGDVVVGLRDVTAQAARRPRLEALAALGAAIQGERSEADLFAHLREALPPLGITPMLLRAMPEGVRVVWTGLPTVLEEAFRGQLGQDVEGFTGHWTGFARTAWDEGVAFSDDWASEAAAFVPLIHAEVTRSLAASHGLSRAVAIRLDERTGVRHYLVLIGDWLRAEDVPAGRLFGAQVAAALDAARTIAELSRHNADLAALNRIAELLGEVSDLEAFFQRAEEELRRASGAAALAVYALDEASGRLLRRHPAHPADPAVPPPEVPAGSELALVAEERLARVVSAGEPAAGEAPLGDWPATAWVPLVARSRTVGVMAAAFAAPAEEARARLDLLGAAAGHFASAIESNTLLTDLRRRVAELTLLNDVSMASAQLDPVLLLDSALRRVCATLEAQAGAAFVREGDALKLVAAAGLDVNTLRRLERVAPGDGLAGQAVQRLAPVLAVEGDPALDATTTEVVAREGLRASVAVPLLAKGRAAVGALVVARRDRRAVGEGEVRLLAALGVQLGVAVENARLFADVRRRLSDLEAVHRITQRIFANAPGDVRALLDDGCRAAASALGCASAALLLVDEDGQTLHTAAAVGARLEPDRARRPLARDGLVEEAIRTGEPVGSDDLTRDPRSALYGRSGVPPMSALAVPLVARAATVGVLLVAGAPGRAFAPEERALATALAGELAVGIENARLYSEARGRLAELATVIDVARVVSSSLDLDEVLLAGAEHLKQTLGAGGCTILLDDPRRQELRRAAHRGPPLGPPSLPLSDRSVLREALDARAPVTGQVPDSGGPALAVPLHVRDHPVGVALVSAAPGRGYSPGELSRAVAIASQLAVAVDNARLYQETRRRAEELSLLHEVGRALVATLDIEQVLEAGVRNLARIVEAPTALLALAVDGGKGLQVRAVWGGPRELIGTRPPVDRPGTLGALAMERREPILVEDVLSDPRILPEQREKVGGRAYLVLPLMVRDRLIGSTMIVESRGPRAFQRAEVERAAAVANQLAVAVENARLYDDLRQSYAELAQAQRQLIQQERLAALGELSAVVAHEVRNPLGVIFNSLGSLRRLLRPEGDARLLLDIVGEEADRLNRIVGDLLDFARPSTPVLHPEKLERVVDDAVAAALVQHAGGVEVRREVEEELPPVPLDERLVRQAVVNVAVNAAQSMPRGGVLTVRLRREGPWAAVELEDTGAGIPEEVRRRIFEPFFTTKASGTGLGLAVVKRIMEGHGGEISVRTRPGAGTVMTLRFPLEPTEDAERS
ncbi:MAG: GAF domain-containing protein [Anaeromyxobacter sp.]